MEGFTIRLFAVQILQTATNPQSTLALDVTNINGTDTAKS